MTGPSRPGGTTNRASQAASLAGNGPSPGTSSVSRAAAVVYTVSGRRAIRRSKQAATWSA